MAKLIAVCVVAACLTVALAGDSNNSNSGAKNEQADATVRQWKSRVKKIERKEEKTVEDWNALETGYSRMLLSESSRLNADKVYKLLEKLEEALKHSKKGERDFPHSVGGYLSFRRDMNCARETSIEARANSLCVFKTNWSMRNYVTDSISRYLKHCKYEEMFKQAISHVDRYLTKHWNWIKYPTLYDYWKKNVRPKEIRYVQTDSNWIIRLVKHISSLQERIDCRDKDLRNSLIHHVVKSKLYHPELYTLVNAYFKKYLSACGLEDRFKTAMTDCGIVTKGGDSAFNYYLMGEYWEQASKNKLTHKSNNYFEDEIKLPAILVVVRLVGPSQIDTSYCNATYKAYLGSYLWDTERKGHTKLHECLKKSSIRHKQVCQAHFIAKAEDFKNKQQDAWSRIENFKAAMEKLTDVKTFNDVKHAVELFKHSLLNGFGIDGKDKKEATDLKREWEQACNAFKETMNPSREAIDYKNMLEETLMGDFYVHLEYCDAMWIDH